MDIGKTIASKYEVIRLLGRGGFGAVHEAVQHPVGRRVAVKTIAPEHARDDEVRGRFLAEASAVAALSHPSIVTLFDYGVEPDGQIYMVLEYIDGLELGRVIRRDGPMAPARVVELGRQALAGLAEAHRRQLVHRDLKPANLMIVVDALGNENLKILDFGIAKLLDQERSQINTRSGYALGTPAYMSPEQAIAKGVGPASDQYALAVVLYEMLSGRPPFEGDSAFEVLTKHAQEPVPPIPNDLEVPAGLEAALSRALSKHAEDRFPDVGAMSDALNAGLVGNDSVAWASRTGPVAAQRRGTRRLPVSTAEELDSTILPPTAALRLGGIVEIAGSPPHEAESRDVIATREGHAGGPGTPPMIGALPTGRYREDERPPERNKARWWPAVVLVLVAAVSLAVLLPLGRDAREPANEQADAVDPIDAPERIKLTAGPSEVEPAVTEQVLDATTLIDEGRLDSGFGSGDAGTKADTLPDVRVSSPPSEDRRSKPSKHRRYGKKTRGSRSRAPQSSAARPEAVPAVVQPSASQPGQPARLPPVFLPKDPPKDKGGIRR